MKVRDHRSWKPGCKSDMSFSSPRRLNRRSGKDAVVAVDRSLLSRQNRGGGFACFHVVIVTILVRPCWLKHGRNWQCRLKSRHGFGLLACECVEPHPGRMVATPPANASFNKSRRLIFLCIAIFHYCPKRDTTTPSGTISGLHRFVWDIPGSRRGETPLFSGQFL